MKNKTLLWALVFALLAAGGLGLYALRDGGTAATLWVDGELYRTIDLQAVAIPYEFDVETEYGVNTVRVSPGEIAVVWSDCPEQVCVNQGSIHSAFIPITCLPHRLVIQIEEP